MNFDTEEQLPSEGELFRKKLGSEWCGLHPDIQNRFLKNPEPGKPLNYTGVLSELSCSRFGRFLGMITKPFIKGALIPYTCKNVKVDIQVYTKPGCPYVFKQRLYHMPEGKAILFTSYMTEDRHGNILEYVSKRLGMKLELYVKDGSLHFTSNGYFWQVLGLRIPIPGIFSPGKTFLSHNNDNPSEFNIRIEIIHALFGLSFTQVGGFREVVARPRAASSGDSDEPSASQSPEQSKTPVNSPSHEELV